MTTERTSKRVARIAGRVLAMERLGVYEKDVFGFMGNKWTKIKWSDIRALAASCLNQAPDKPSLSTQRQRSLISAKHTVRRPRAKKAGKHFPDFPKFAPYKRKLGKPTPRNGKVRK